MSRWINECYAGLKEYTPGEQPTDMNYIKLNTNESPFAPSPSVLRAVNGEAVSMLNLYPDPTCKRLKQKLAKLYGVNETNVFVSNGSDDILNFSFLAFCNASDHPVRFPSVSYGFYRVYAELYHTRYTEVPLNPDFTIDINEYLHNDSTVVIANPNAPTGLALSKSEIERIVAANSDHLVLIDEAYVDFGAESCVELIHRYPNLLVVQTYSKSRSMAGARLGFAFGNSELIADLEKIKFSTNPYNINRLTLLAGEAAVEEDSYYKNHCRQIAEIREDTQTRLRQMGFVCTDSKANFIFAKSSQIGGKELYLRLKERGILVRHFDTPSICEYNRITVGTKAQMDCLIDTIASIVRP